jgi:hypothetical protein
LVLLLMTSDFVCAWQDALEALRSLGDKCVDNAASVFFTASSQAPGNPNAVLVCLHARSLRALEWLCDSGAVADVPTLVNATANTTPLFAAVGMDHLRLVERLIAAGACFVVCVVSCRVVSCRVVSCRVVSCRVVSCRVVS